MQNKDGLVDIVTSNYNGNQVAWFANLGGSPASWSTMMGVGSLSSANSVVAVDGGCAS